MKWKNLFAKHILERGRNYYFEGEVDDFRKKKDSITATVYGTDAYDVEITIKKDNIIDMYCSCPYAEDGNYCKHMAAVLFAYEEEVGFCAGDVLPGENSEDIELPDSAAEIAAVVENAEETFVRKFLISVLENDEPLYMRFKRLVSAEISKEDVKCYKKQMDEIVHKYTGRDRFIGYREAHAFIRELKEILYEDIEEMLDSGHEREAFELTCHLFITAGNVDIDDSDGELGSLAWECCEIWKKILDTDDMELKRFLYQWFLSHLDGSVIDYMEEYIEQILMEEFQEKEFLLEKLAFTEKKVEAFEHQTDAWTSRYYAGKWAVSHLSLMQLLGKTWKEQKAYCKEHWAPSEVRRWYIERCMELKDNDTVIDALKESIQMDKDLPGLVSGYRKQLKDLYQKQGNHEAYMDCLWKLILKENAGDLEVFRELKRQYSDEEWKQEREVIFENLPGFSDKERLYKEEKLYDRLLECVLKTSGLYALYQYQDVLIKQYPEEILDKYTKEVEKMAKPVSNRSCYQEIIQNLRQMQKIPGGKKRVEEIAARWRMEYRKRPAMMDELNKLS